MNKGDPKAPGNDNDSDPDFVIWTSDAPSKPAPPPAQGWQPPSIFPPPPPPSQSLFPRGIGEMLNRALAAIPTAPPPPPDAEEADDSIPVTHESLRPAAPSQATGYRSLKPPPASALKRVWMAFTRRVHTLFGRNT